MRKISLLALSVFVIGCGTSSDENQIDTTKAPTNSELSEKLKIGMTKKEVIDIVGEPQYIFVISDKDGKTQITKFSNRTYTRRKSEGGEFSFLNGKLFHFQMYRSEF